MKPELTPPADSCPACGAAGMAPWRAATPADGRAGEAARYTLMSCPACGSAALRGPEAGPELYESGTYAATRPWIDRLLEPYRRLIDLDRLRLLGGVGDSERVLEVGAGRGRLLAALARRGVDATGIEPSRTLWTAARQHGVTIVNTSLEEAEVPRGSRDLVILWHVLEHLDRPALALERIRPWLAEGGRAVVAVPNLASLQASLGGDRWFHQDVPRHRVQFTADGLERLLARSGFTPVKTRPAIVDQGILGMWVTLMNRLTTSRDVPFRFVKGDLNRAGVGHPVRDAVVSLALGLPLALIAAVLETGAALAGRGGSIVVEARLD